MSKQLDYYAVKCDESRRRMGTNGESRALSLHGAVKILSYLANIDESKLHTVQLDFDHWDVMAIEPPPIIAEGYHVGTITRKDINGAEK